MRSLPSKSYESEEQVDNPMEKTCAAEKNRTTDTVGRKKGEKRKKGGSTPNRKEPYDVLKRT